MVLESRTLLEQSTEETCRGQPRLGNENQPKYESHDCTPDLLSSTVLSSFTPSDLEPAAKCGFPVFKMGPRKLVQSCLVIPAYFFQRPLLFNSVCLEPSNAA
ncbi:hypothetical protein STEG23_035562 [Scotinomys teguina]